MGEQKLIAFAWALMCRPNLLFLDEWTESLDDSGANRLIRLVERHQKEKKTVIFVNHDFKIIKSLSDYIVMIVDGKLSSVFSREQIEKDENLAHHIEEGITS
jgi:ABC-type multidrug transport system ATPase subunit